MEASQRLFRQLEELVAVGLEGLEGEGVEAVGEGLSFRGELTASQGEKVEDGGEGGGEHGEEGDHAVFSLRATVAPGSDIACSSCCISSSNLFSQNPRSLASMSSRGSP